MVSFFVCLAILIIGFMVYSKFTEKVFGPDDRKPPALTMTCLLYTSCCRHLQQLLFYCFFKNTTPTASGPM